MAGLIVLLVVAALVLMTLARTIRIVPQARASVVERLGRYSRTLTPGLTIVVPFIDRIRETIDLREQVVSFAPQPVITEDNLVVSIDTVIYFQVTEPKSATYEIANYIAAIEQLTAAHLVRLGEAGIKTLDELADLASDELIEILGEDALSAEDANAVIMAARAHWFEADEVAAATAAPAPVPSAHHAVADQPAATPARRTAYQSTSASASASPPNASAVAGSRRRAAAAMATATRVAPPSSPARPASPRLTHATTVKMSAATATRAAPSPSSTPRTTPGRHSRVAAATAGGPNTCEPRSPGTTWGSSDCSSRFCSRRSKAVSAASELCVSPIS